LVELKVCNFLVNFCPSLYISGSMSRLNEQS